MDRAADSGSAGQRFESFRAHLEKLVIKGGKRLSGKVKISGSKNAALPMMAASLLTDEEVIIKNVPDLRDIRTMTELLEYIGCKVTRKEETIYITPPKKPILEAPYEIVSKMRASYYVLGPLLGRFRRCRVSLPGGCAIGPRPIDLHIKGMEKLGAEIRIEKGYIIAFAKKLKGTEMFLEGPKGSSVGATINVMMASVLCDGNTVIYGAAMEPEVIAVAKMLKKMGAKIEGEGTKTIRIRGVKKLHGATFKNIQDRIEAGTYAVAIAITKGEGWIENAPVNDMKAVIEKLKETGVEMEIEKNSIWVKMDRRPKGVEISTAPYPGFPTDMQAQFMAFLCFAKGTSVIKENIFENRFMQAMELQRMGANIVIEGNTAVIKGVSKLTGAKVMASDLRASAALVLAGLSARGITEVSRIYHLDRGYEKLDEKLKKLGAEIERKKE